MQGKTTPTLTIARDGAFRMTLDVLLTQSAGEWAQPVDELVRYLEQIVGARVPRESDRSLPAAFQHFTAPTQEETKAVFTAELDVQGDLEAEEFDLEVSADGIRLCARTEDGMSHGVHFFLEQLCGVRWLWPGATGESVPSRPTLDVPLGHWREKPDYAWRRIGVHAAIWERYDYETAERTYLGLDPSYIAEFNLWCRRNRMGGARIADGHRLAMMLPADKLGGEHPEYFALLGSGRDATWYNGKHNNQPCTSNPEVVSHVARFVNAAFDAFPHLDAISITPNDGARICECEDCIAIDEAAGRVDIRQDTGAMAADVAGDKTVTQAGKTLDMGSVTDRMFRYANGVHAQVRDPHPEKNLVLLVYGPYRNPPKATKLDSGILAQFCTQCNRYTDPAWRENELAILRALKAYAGDVGIYEYYEQGVWSGVHRLFPHLVAQSVRDFHDAGARYFATQPGRGFATNGINFYVLAHSLWDVALDADELIDDFCRHAFGPAADVMRCYLDAFEKRWQDTNALETLGERWANLALPMLYDADFRAARRADLARARELATTDTERVRIAFYADGFELTDAMTEAFVAVRALMASLERPDLPALAKDELPAEGTQAQRELLDEAGRRMATAVETAERLKGKFVYPEFFFYYSWGRTALGWTGMLDALAERWDH